MRRRRFLQGCVFGSATSLAAASATDRAESLDDKRAYWRAAWLDLLGPFPQEKPPLNAVVEARGLLEPGIEYDHLRFQSEAGDWITAFLLRPEAAFPGPAPVIICPHSTTRGAGKSRIIGQCGATLDEPPDPPESSRAYGLELARWGYPTLCLDLPCDGERIPQGYPHYHTGPFYEKHPAWSIMGKIAWDISRSVDFLQTLDWVDQDRIACLGHSLGAQSAVFSAAFDPRIAVAVSNGGMLSWVRDTDHWARPADPKNRPVHSWSYIPRFRPYIDDPARPIPIDFTELMMLIAPRPLLVMASEGEMRTHDTINKVAEVGEWYRGCDAGDRVTLFSYPGAHNYPPTAKRFSFAWLDRWLNHSPVIPTLWPGQKV